MYTLVVIWTSEDDLPYSLPGVTVMSFTIYFFIEETFEFELVSFNWVNLPPTKQQQTWWPLTMN